MFRFRLIFSAVIALSLFLLWLSSPLIAAEPVEIIVEGVEGDALKNVRESLALPYGLVHDGKVDSLWLERFVQQADEKCRTALEPFGYYHALVTARLETVKEGEYRLRVKVVPGEPVRVTGVKVALLGPGAGENDLKKLKASFPLEKGSVLQQQQYEQAKGSLLTQAQKLGYLDAGFPVHEIRIDEGETGARIELVMESGARYLFDDARIEGAPDYPDKFLRRYLAFKPGEVFSYAMLGETQLNFTNSERFKEVIITPEKEEARDNRVPVLVKLNPAPRRSFRFGAGYGTDTGGRFTIRYRDLNLFHLGHEFYSILYVAERLQGFTSGYILPGYRDIKSSTTLQLNLQQEMVTTYTSRLIALELDRNRSFGKGKVGTAYLRLQQEQFTIGGQDSSSRLVLPGLRYSEDHLDNMIRPVRGYRFALDMRGTHQFLGSDSALLQLITEVTHVMPLPWRLSLHSRAKAGLTLWSDPLTDLPPSLRFFAGGDQSVRGYSYQSLGPRNAIGQVIGGKHLLFGSVELERALFKDWGISLFYDTGNAFDTFPDFHLAQGAGIGLHYYTRVGALNLSLARQIGVESPSFHVHFTVGFEL